MNMVNCKICNTEYKDYSSLGKHIIKTHHMTAKEYYDAYLKVGEEGTCPVCGKETSFRTIGQGYKTYCSRKCSANAIASDPERNTHKLSAYKETMLEKHCVDNASKLDSVALKRQETMVDRYGVPFYSQTVQYAEEVKATMKSRYGVEAYSQLPEMRVRLIKSANVRWNARANVSTKEKK